MVVNEVSEKLRDDLYAHRAFVFTLSSVFAMVMQGWPRRYNDRPSGGIRDKMFERRLASAMRKSVIAVGPAHAIILVCC